MNHVREVGRFGFDLVHLIGKVEDPCLGLGFAYGGARQTQDFVFVAAPFTAIRPSDYHVSCAIVSLGASGADRVGEPLDYVFQSLASLLDASNTHLRLCGVDQYYAELHKMCRTCPMAVRDETATVTSA